MSRGGTELKLAFALVLFGAGGCNALLGNGYGVDDSESSLLDGGGGGDALVEGGNGDDGGVGPDGSMTGDGSVLDANVDGGGCLNGVCPTLVMTVVGPQRLALSTKGVYWASLTSFGRVNLDGSNPLAPKPILGPIAMGTKRGIAVDPAETAVYVTMPASDKAALKCVPDLSSCSTSFIGNQGAASDIAFDATRVYVSIYDEGASNTGEIWHTALDGTNAAPNGMMTDQVIDLQVIGANMFFRTPTAIKSAGLTTAPVSAVNVAAEVPLAFVVSNNNVIYATAKQLHGCVLALPTACQPNVITLTKADVSAMTADSTRIYWVERVAGTVHRCDIANCQNTDQLVATGQASPNDIVVDGTSIYWANYGDAQGTGGSIMKLPK